MHSSRRILIVALICAFCTITFSQQNVSSGFTVTTRKKSTNSFDARDLLNFGSIHRYNITNNTAQFSAELYTGSDGRCARISPDGSMVAFIRGNGDICVVNSSGGAFSRLGNIGKNNGEGFIDWPLQGWIYYTHWSTSTVYRVNTSDGAVETVGNTGLSNHWTISISRDTKRACFSANHGGWTTYVMDIGTGSITNVRRTGQCGGSLSPNGALFTMNDGDHVGATIHRFTDFSLVHRLSAGSENWNVHRWSSNSNDWVTFTVGKGYQLDSYTNQILYYVPNSGATRIKVTNNGPGSFNTGDDFWIGTVSTTPSISLSATTLQFETQTGTNPASKKVTVTNSGSGTLPALSAASSKTWCTPTMSGSGNSYELTISVNASSLASGTHDAAVTVSGQNLTPATLAVSLKVIAPPVLTSIKVTDETVAPGAAVQLNAQALDQFGTAMNPQPSFAWAMTSGSGTVSANGLFTATAFEGTAVVKATSGTISGAGTILIRKAPDVHVKVNCGGTGVSGWENGTARLVGTAQFPSFTFEGPHDLSAVTDPAPAAVYTTATLDVSRLEYQFTELPAGSYAVRLHFTLGSIHTGLFNMDWSIQGKEVLSNFDVKTDAGGYDKAVVKQFAVTLNSAGTLTVVGNNDGGITVFCGGIEVIGGGEDAAVTITAPNDGESFKTGDVMKITYEGDPSRFGGAMIQLSVDNGDNWVTISGASSFPAFENGATTGVFEWIVPQALGGETLSSQTCLIKMFDYMAPDLFDESDNTFSINADLTALGSRSSVSARPIEIDGTGIRIAARGADVYTIQVFDLMGKCLFNRHVTGSVRLSWSETGLKQGVYVTSIHSQAGTVSEKIRVGVMR